MSAEPDMVDDARLTIRDLMARHHVPGLTVAVTDANRLLFAEGFGHADLAARRPATALTSYLWFSMSKIATATAAMQLADEGRLDLDSPVSDLVPEYVARSGEHPRLRQLLDHTAGAANPLPVRWVLPADADAVDIDALAERVLVRHGRQK